MTRRALFGLVCASVVALGANNAHALQDFADEIKRALDLDDKPSCLFCHKRNDRGIAVDTPFSGSLKDRGFTRRLGVPSLTRALTRLDDENVDSDDDGVRDIDELTAGANPNDPTDGGMPPASCSVTDGSRGVLSGTSTLIFVSLALWLRRRAVLR